MFCHLVRQFYVLHLHVRHFQHTPCIYSDFAPGLILIIISTEEIGFTCIRLLFAILQ